MYFARCDPKTKPQLTSTVAGSVVGPTVVVKCESLLLNRGEGFILARAFFELPQLTVAYEMLKNKSKTQSAIARSTGHPRSLTWYPRSSRDFSMHKSARNRATGHARFVRQPRTIVCTWPQATGDYPSRSPLLPLLNFDVLLIS